LDAIAAPHRNAVRKNLVLRTLRRKARELLAKGGLRMKYSESDFLARVFLVTVILLLTMGVFTSTGCGSGGDIPVTPVPESEAESIPWISPVHHYTAEVFPSDYIIGKEYQFVLMKSVGDAVDAKPNEFIVGLYTADDALYPYGASLHMISVGNLYVNEDGKFTALEPGQKILKVEVRDFRNRLYATIQFGPYFTYGGSDWESPVSRFNIEAQPEQYVVGQFYDMELVANMGDLVNRKTNQIMIGLYRKSDEGAIFSDVLGLKFVPSGGSLFINEFGKFTADSPGQKKVIAQVVDDEHLYITIVCHPYFVAADEEPPPPPPPPVNQAPVITGHSPQDYIILEVGAPAQVFSVTGYDPDDDPLNTWWVLEGCDPIKSGSYTFYPTEVGTWMLIGTLSDGSLQDHHSWTIEVQEEGPLPQDNNLYPVDNDGNIDAYYGGNGLQSIPLEVCIPGSGVGFVLWELVSGSSGAMTVPIGSNPAVKCEFYYESTGIYTVWATPYVSEGDYQDDGSPIGEKAIFFINVLME